MKYNSSGITVLIAVGMFSFIMSYYIAGILFLFLAALIKLIVWFMNNG